MQIKAGDVLIADADEENAKLFFTMQQEISAPSKA
jgi:hypothetical protein